MRMKRLFVSQPMNGRSTNEIAKERSKIAEEFAGEYAIADSFFDYTVVEGTSDPLYKLGNALEVMAGCDAAYFAPGWEKARGCLVEHMAAELYDVPILAD